MVGVGVRRSTEELASSLERPRSRELELGRRYGESREMYNRRG